MHNLSRIVSMNMNLLIVFCIHSNNDEPVLPFKMNKIIETPYQYEVYIKIFFLRSF